MHDVISKRVVPLWEPQISDVAEVKTFVTSSHLYYCTMLNIRLFSLSHTAAVHHKRIHSVCLHILNCQWLQDPFARY